MPKVVTIKDRNLSFISSYRQLLYWCVAILGKLTDRDSVSEYRLVLADKWSSIPKIIGDMLAKRKTVRNYKRHSSQQRNFVRKTRLRDIREAMYLHSMNPIHQQIIDNPERTVELTKQTNWLLVTAIVLLVVILLL